VQSPVLIGSAFVAQYPTGGGNFWVPLQYVLGLRALGVDAYWLELLFGKGDPEWTRACATAFLDAAGRLGIADRTALAVFPDGRAEGPGRVEYHGGACDAVRARWRDALLLNLAHSVPASLRAELGRTALVDIDPGPFQIWAREHDLGVGRHDVHLTIGRNLGAPDSPVPLGGIDWRRFWPPVHLPAWPVQPDPGTTYTTVTQWWTGQYAVLDGEVYDCNKRPSFLEMIDLPRRLPVGLELAANIHPGETEDLDRLARHGWRVVDPAVVAGTPETFRTYVQSSRGELSCAKPGYVRSRPGWVSDRTICYLASGRPCVVQATGAEAHLPDGPGLRFFASLDEAVDALRAVEADYPAAARAARRLAEDVFAAEVVLPGLLAAAGA
jgi:hypothetical protein